MINQGDLPLTISGIADYIPTGYNFAPADNGGHWELDTSNGQLRYIGTPIQLDVGKSAIITLTLTVSNSATNSTLRNFAEISMISDREGKDVVGDEDDHDFAEIQMYQPPTPRLALTAPPSSPSPPPILMPSNPRGTSRPVPLPSQLPKNYAVEQISEDEFIIFDENGSPLRTIKVPPGLTLDDLDILDNLNPFGKPNPTTSDDGTTAVFISSTCLLSFTALLLILMKSRMQQSMINRH